MKPKAFAVACGLLLLSVVVNGQEAQMRAKATKELQNGNFNDAYKVFRQLVLDSKTDAKAVGQDLGNTVQCLQNLGRQNEIDELIESGVKTQEKNWRFLQAAADQYLNVEHQGFLIAGKFERGGHRGGGKAVNSVERDRVRALQLVVQAMPLAVKDDDKPAVGRFFLSLANQLLYNRGFEEAWRLQYKVDLNTLPDYDDGFMVYREYVGAPVDAEGNPVYHRPAKSWDEAENDGGRWRWALEMAIENHPPLRDDVKMQQAQFYQAQFGVETLANFGWGRFFGLPTSDDDTKKDESGTYELHTLKETETIAKLANGIKRFTLPDEFNYLKLIQELAAGKSNHAENAANLVAQSFENRRQFPKAAEVHRANVKRFGDANWRNQHIQQIVGNWGRFEGTRPEPSGQGATVEFRFRNGKRVDFEAQPVNVELLLTDLKAYLKSDPKNLDWQKIDLSQIGWRLVHNNEGKYVGKAVATWKLDLQPRDAHFDRRITVTTPLQKAGAYLVTAKMANGNTSKILLWLADTAIVHKQLSDRQYYYVADAVSGQPVPAANLEFFGYKFEQLGNGRQRIVTANFSEIADADGQAIPDPRDLKTDDFQWLVISRTKSGRLAFLGFQGLWYQRWHDEQYHAIKVFSITDRPVYRPEQTVKFKFWVGEGKYDQDDKPRYAGATFPVRITDPKGEKIHEQTLKADEFGGVTGEWKIPADGTLGQYQLAVDVSTAGQPGQPFASGGGTFRVEEYKKPEFEVSVEAPKEPVALGEPITAKITAKYYFGSPVTKATVKYKIVRTSHEENWFPRGEWDWCYGPGYWWFAYDCPWYPGWNEWAGCFRPHPWWWPRMPQPPEVVAEQELPISQDGTVEVKFDTAPAKTFHPNTDHQYAITAEVRDESRRTIVGSGNVLVARKPFKVYTWVDRGYYRVGETIRAEFLAQTLDRRPVSGKGVLELFKITYDKNNKPLKTPVQKWDITTNDEGRAFQQIAATAKGQYRLSLKVTDAAGKHTIEGGYLFTIIGEGFDGREYRFNDLELIPDRREYQPGDKVRLQVNTNRAGAAVVVFVRPANGVYLKPKVVRLTGKSLVEEIEVLKKDMPNFYVEALSVANAKVHQETKELVVPPEKRILNVEVLPSSKEYKPGEEAKVKIRLTDHTGENYVGQTVVSIYDKSVEYISGGSNVPDIREFFWKWRRNHQPTMQNSLATMYSWNLGLPNQPEMQGLGIFGQTVAEEMDALADDRATAFSMDGAMPMRGFAPGLGGMGGMGGGMGRFAPMAKMERAAPTGAALALADAFSAPAAGTEAGADPGAPAAPQLQQPTVRTNFADTALWVGALTTDKTGMAEVSLKMPENLTGWKVKVWALGHGTRVGSGESEVVTRKNLLVRLQTPRFFIQKDEVVISGNVHNYLKSDKEVTVTLDVGHVSNVPGRHVGNVPHTPLTDLTRVVKIPAGDEKRVDFRIRIDREGEAILRLKALTDEESDAMELKVPAYVHGLLKTESWAGTVRPDKDSAKVSIRVPAERRPEQSVLEIRYSPTLAGAMVDALPYLADYPYGCTEQTLNRFLPSAVTQKVLRELGVNLAAIRDKRANLNAQEIGDDRQRATQWKRFDRNPVFDEDELNRMVREGLKALTNMQCSDGGWGWFSGYGEHSWPHTTAVVVHGLQIAQQNDVPLVPGVLERGIDWLKRYQSAELQKLKNAPSKTRPWKDHADDLDALVYMILVDAGSDSVPMRDFLYRDRVQLAVYSKAMFGLALHKVNDAEKLAMILRNIEQFLVQDAENETAYLKLPENNWWWVWYGSETEANAYYLKLLARTDAKGVAAPRLVKYLLNNRKHATYWSNTRDTALCVEAFADYLRASGEDKPDLVVEVFIDGEKRKEVTITAETLFTFDNKLLLTGADLKDGPHDIELRRRGTGPIYFNAYLTNFTLEDPITKAGLELKIDRKFYKLVRVDAQTKVSGSRGQALDQKVEKYDRQPLANLSVLKPGDLVEIELEFESKNDYEYILFEDLKAAGFEPVSLQSGYTANGLGAYTEFRDNRVTFFVRHLARGKNSISYRLRAETPGQFSALPAKASAMYAPELKANSDESKLKVED